MAAGHQIVPKVLERHELRPQLKGRLTKELAAPLDLRGLVMADARY